MVHRHTRTRTHAQLREERKGKGENLFRKEHTCLRAHTPVSICVERGLEKCQALQWDDPWNLIWYSPSNPLLDYRFKKNPSVCTQRLLPKQPQQHSFNPSVCQLANRERGVRALLIGVSQSGNGLEQGERGVRALLIRVSQSGNGLGAVRVQTGKWFRFQNICLWPAVCKYSKIYKTLKSGALRTPCVSNKGPEFSYSVIQNWGLCFVVVVETGLHPGMLEAWSSSASTSWRITVVNHSPQQGRSIKQTSSAYWTKDKTLLSVDYLYKVLRKCISRDKPY